MTRDFWRSSGYHLLARTPQGRLALTDEFLRAYFARPEMLPVDESCAAEITLHDALMADPRLPVPDDRLATLADPDARENYQIVLAFRDHLLAHDTIEAGYLALFRSSENTVPPLFIDQLTHVILRNILDGCEDPLRLRAAELFFRSQRLTLRDGAIMLADEDTVEMFARTGGLGSLASSCKTAIHRRERSNWTFSTTGMEIFIGRARTSSIRCSTSASRGPDSMPSAARWRTGSTT